MLSGCLKPTNPNLDLVLLVRDLGRDHAHVPSPNLVPVLALFHARGNAGSVLGPVQGHILHLITGKGTIQESIRTGICLTFLAKDWDFISIRIFGVYKISEGDRRWEMRLQILSGTNNNKMCFFYQF